MAGSMRQWWVVPGVDGGELELRDVPVPEVSGDQVLIEVVGAGINRGELLGRQALVTKAPGAHPRPSGIEFSGRIKAIGPDVIDWTPGDRVMGRGTACHGQYTVAQASALMGVSEHLSLHQAAAIPNVFVTAHDAIVSAAKLQPGERILITAGSSGVGTAAIQIARYMGAGAILATTRSSAKGAALRALGATEVIDTSNPGWRDAQTIDNVDVVIDQVGGALTDELLRTMAIEGRYVSVGRNGGKYTSLDLDWLAVQRLHLIGVTFRTRTPEEALACSQRFATDLLPAVNAGDLRPVIDSIWDLEALPQAHRAMGQDQQTGKLILAVLPDDADTAA